MRSRTIVLAENDNSVEELVLSALTNVRSDVIVRKDGESVVDIFLHNGMKLFFGQGGHSNRVRWMSYDAPRQYDLLLLDLSLPKLDGLKVLRQLRWLFRDDLSRLPPIVVLSESNDDHLVAAAYRYGCSGFLCTSVPAPFFCKAVRQTIGYWCDVMLRPSPSSHIPLPVSSTVIPVPCES